jgi:hypothetical protein
MISGCVPPEVLEKPVFASVEESKIRKKCYKIADGDGVSTSFDVTSKFDMYMRNSGFIKTPQWQQK